MELFFLAWLWLSMIIRDKILPFCPHIFFIYLSLISYLHFKKPF
jgi:hypothetical protein